MKATIHAFVALVAWVATLSDAAGTFRVQDPVESICPGAGSGMTGYYDFRNDSKHLFFWLAESRANTTNDPLVLWMSGGPGASSVGLGLFAELGPCLIDGPDSVVRNDQAWNNNANILFVDQPSRVGFSYSDSPVDTLQESMEDMYAFLVDFIEEFPQFAKQDFYIVGESFGGTWVTALALTIHRRQSTPLASLVQSTTSLQEPTLNLKGIGLGNSQLSQSLQWPGFYKTGCLGEDPIFNATTCAVIQENMATCVQLLESCQSQPEVCVSALNYCREKSVWFIMDEGLNPYDIREECKVPGICYEEPGWIEEYLNSDHIRNELQVPDHVTFVAVDMDLNEVFARKGYVGHDPIEWLEQILNKGYRVLMFAGNKDWFCNADGERRMTSAIRWKHQTGFQNSEERVWKVGNKEAGLLKHYDSLSFAEVFDAGHMVPKNKPAEALALFNGWLQGSLLD